MQNKNKNLYLSFILLLKTIFAILLIPALVVYLQAFGDTVKIIRTSENLFSNKFFLLLSYGFFLWLFIFLFMWRPVFIYTISHELTHALFIKLFRGKVRKIKITGRGGYVKSDKTNDIIRLSPYFFPFYTILLIIIYLIIIKFDLIKNKHVTNYIFSFLIGISYSFHITFTAWLANKDQSDLTISGFFYSIMQIIILNLLTITAIIIIFSKNISFKDFYDLLIIRFINSYSYFAIY